MAEKARPGPWHDAWIDALCAGARVDAEALLDGVRSATPVGQLTIAPGEVTGVVGSGRSTRTVRLGIRRWTTESWDTAVTALAASTLHSAAIGSGTLDISALDALNTVGLALLPGPADVSWECSCNELAVPCKHQVALAVATARALDVDPLALVVLRGRERMRVAAQVAKRRTPVQSTLLAEPALGSTDTAPAATAWAGRRPGDPLVRPLPRARMAPREPAGAPHWPAAPPATEADAPRAADLARAVKRGARRAWEALLSREEPAGD